MKTRFDYCPCCECTSFSTFYNNPQVKPLKQWPDFFYGGAKYIRDIIECRNCSFKFINTLEENYHTYYQQEDISSYLELSACRVKYFSKLKMQLIGKGLCVSREQKILDVGCGCGDWLSCWENPHRCYGDEVNPTSLEILRNREIAIYEAENSSDDFALVSAFDFLEHVENPADFLIELSTKVKRPGCLVISVPNMGKLVSKLLGPKYYLYCPMHFSYFTYTALRELITRTCQPSKLQIFNSPTMGTSLKGALKWVAPGIHIPERMNWVLPIGYSASLIALVTLK